MSIALNSAGKIPFIFENGTKNSSSRKAKSADIAAGCPVTADADGLYTVSADLTTQALLDAVDGILLNDIVYESAAFGSNASQGVTSRTSLGHNQFSGTMSINGAGNFRTTKHDDSMAVGDSVSWDGTEYVKAVAASSDAAIGDCVAKADGYIRVAIRKHIVA